MREIKLLFQGYTWDEYFHMISNKSGILVVYSGGLDSEGAIKMHDVIYVDDADELIIIYESEKFEEVRKSVGNYDRLFYSYVEMNQEGRADIKDLLRNHLLPRTTVKDRFSDIKLKCQGACALFPKKIL